MASRDVCILKTSPLIPDMRSKKIPQKTWEGMITSCQRLIMVGEAADVSPDETCVPLFRL